MKPVKTYEILDHSVHIYAYPESNEYAFIIKDKDQNLKAISNDIYEFQEDAEYAAHIRIVNF